MKRFYLSVFILMAVIAVSFFSLLRVSRGSREITAGIDSAVSHYRRTGDFPTGQVDTLIKDWKAFYKSISFAENTGELNDISRLFAELKASEDIKDFTKESELIKVSLQLLRENETPYWYSIL